MYANAQKQLDEQCREIDRARVSAVKRRHFFAGGVGLLQRSRITEIDDCANQPERHKDNTQITGERRFFVVAETVFEVFDQFRFVRLFRGIFVQPFDRAV